jgi:hypothetical protein
MSNKGIDLIINYKDMLERNILSMEHKLNRQKLELQEVILYLTENCDHKIEIDYIDSIKNGETMSQIIKYCKKCNLTF